jgi:hypothetical protein
MTDYNPTSFMMTDTTPLTGQHLCWECHRPIPDDEFRVIVLSKEILMTRLCDACAEDGLDDDDY